MLPADRYLRYCADAERYEVGQPLGGTFATFCRSRCRPSPEWLITWIILFDWYVLQPHYGSGVDSATNRNEY
jgi:hypothetical protein